MATGGFFGEFERVAECPVCHQAVTEARQLSCLHAFCTKCLQGLIDEAKTSASIPCPVCSFKVETQDIESFPLASFLNSYSQALDKLLFLKDEKNCSVCKQKELETVGSHVCLDCTKVFCDSCHFCHDQLLSKHQTHPITSIDAPYIDGFLRERKEVCSKHDQKDVEYCCHECSQLLCVSCVMEGHKEHVVDKLQTSALTYKLKLQEVVGNLNTELSKCMKTAEDYKETSGLLKAAHKNCRDNIQRHAKSAKLQIDETQARLLQDVDKKEREWTGLLNTRTENLESSQKRMKQSIHYLTLVQQKGTDTEICQTMIADKERLEAVAEDVSGDRHKVPVPNLHLDDCSELFKIPAFLHVDKVSELILPYKPGGITLDKNGRIAVCEYAGSRASVFDTNGDEYVRLKTKQDAKLVDITCNDSMYFVSDMRAYFGFNDYNGDIIGNMYTAKLGTTEDFCLDIFGDSVYGTSKTFVFSLKLDGRKVSQSSKCSISSLNDPSFIAVNESHIVLSYRVSHKIEAYDKDGKELFTYGKGRPGSGDGELDSPWGVAVDNQGCIFISDSNNKRVVVLSPTGKLLGYIGYCDGLYEAPHPLAVTQDGKLLVCWGNMDGDGPWKVTTFSYTVVGPVE